MRNKAYHRYLLLFIFISVFGIAKAQDIRINEVQYTNGTTLTDAEGDTPDWIELYNSGNEPVNLKAYALSDEEIQDTYWTFPDLTLGPGEFLIVFASNKDTVLNNEYHTDFGLKVLVDTLYLFSPENRIIDSIAPQCVPRDKSLGRTNNGTGDFEVMEPTPGNSNNTAKVLQIDYQFDTLSVFPDGGFYDTELHVELKNANPQNEIFYTLNGNDPDEMDSVYTQSIPLYDINANKNRFEPKCDKWDYDPGDLLSKGNILRAVVYSGGCPASNEISRTYFINKEPGNKYRVPVMSLITDKDNLFDDDEGIYVKGNHSNYFQHGKKWEREVHIEFFDSTGTKQFNHYAGMRIHGRGSRSSPQKSIRLYARAEYGKEFFEYPFFKQKPYLDKFRTVLMRATRGLSGVLFKDEACQHIVEELDLDYSAAQTVITFINGEYWGVHSLRERYDEGYIENNYNITNPQLTTVSYDPGYGTATESGDSLAYDQFIAFLEQIDIEAEETYDKIGEQLDIPSYIDFFCAQLYLANNDFPFNNLELWKLTNDTSRWRAFFFDMDATFIRVNYNHLSDYNNDFEFTQRYPGWSTYIFRRLLQNPKFRDRFSQRFYYLLNNDFSPERVLGKIEYFEQLYTPLVDEHTYRWNTPVDFMKWKHNVDMMKFFAMQRPLEINKQLVKNFGGPFMIFPNPSTGSFTLRCKQPNENFTYKLYSVDGKLIERSPVIKSGDIKLTIDKGAGLYILKFKIGQMEYAEKLIIQ